MPSNNRSLSTELPNGVYQGEIVDCKIEMPRVRITIRNTDGSVGIASWVVWTSEGDLYLSGGADAFNKFAKKALSLTEDIKENEVETICQEMIGVCIIYENRKHYSSKMDQEYNRFFCLERFAGVKQPEQLEQAKRKVKSVSLASVVSYIQGPVDVETFETEGECKLERYIGKDGNSHGPLKGGLIELIRYKREHPPRDWKDPFSDL